MNDVIICSVDELPITGAKRFDNEAHGLRVAVVRTSDGTLFVLDDECSHADFSLSEGEVDESELTIECPKHGALFALDSGQPECLPATKPVKTYKWRIEDGSLYLENENE